MGIFLYKRKNGLEEIGREYCGGKECRVKCGVLREKGQNGRERKRGKKKKKQRGKEGWWPQRWPKVARMKKQKKRKKLKD